ncbi:MAG TPA: MnhB domain-containing protein [bacterium]
MLLPHASPIVRLTTRIAQPFLWLFGLYVLAHGHESPGGGFQAGTLLASSFILEAVSFGADAPFYSRMRAAAFRIAAAGILIYGGIGAITAFETWFLDYGALPLAWLEAPARRWWGIFGVETGVCLVVMAALVGIFDRLAEGAAR